MPSHLPWCTQGLLPDRGWHPSSLSNFASSLRALCSQATPHHSSRSGDFIRRRSPHNGRLGRCSFEYPPSSILFRHHPEAGCRSGGGFFCPQNRTNSLQDSDGPLRCFLRPHSDQRHVLSSLSSCEVAWLLAHPFHSLLRSFSETTGTCQSLFHFNPSAQCGWQRPVLLVQQEASLRRHPSDSHLWLRPICSGCGHS